jgi:2-amino-4-hydroxy-6-hydroxymethyldihydropteridine diphosphokinase
MYIKRELTNNLTVFKSLRFPYISSKKKYFRYEVVIGIGGNIGDVRRRFNHLFTFFQKDKRVQLLESSLILKNPPFGYIKQEDFFNSIIKLRVNMQPLQLLNYLMRVEKKFSRKRSFKDAPRTLDLDIIFFEKRKINSEILTIPHKDWQNRDSVLIPLKSMQK